MPPYDIWITADASHIAQIASWTEETEDGLVAHFSRTAVRGLRDHARETRPAARQTSGREEVMCMSFDTMKDRTDCMVAVLELGGEIIPQAILPGSVSAALVP